MKRTLWTAAPALALCALLADCGSTTLAAGGDTIFVANYSTASVTVYPPPYTAAPAVLQIGAYSNGRPVALAYDAAARRLFVGAGEVVQIYAEPFASSSRPIRILKESGDVLALGVEHHFYRDGLLEVATSGPNGGIQAYSGRNGYAGAAFGRANRVIAETMTFDTSGHLFVADRSRSDGSILLLSPLTGRAFAPPVTHFLLGPSALTFDPHGNLWAGNYDVRADGTESGLAAFPAPFSHPTLRIPNEGPASVNSDNGSDKLLFDANALLFNMRIADVRVASPPYDGKTSQVYQCSDASGECDPYDMTLTSHGTLVVAVRSLSCQDGSGSVLLLAPPFSEHQTPSTTIVQGVACPAAVAAAPAP